MVDKSTPEHVNKLMIRPENVSFSNLVKRVFANFSLELGNDVFRSYDEEFRLRYLSDLIQSQ